MASHLREGLCFLWSWWAAQTLGSHSSQAQHLKSSRPWVLDPEFGLQQIRAADCYLLNRQDHPPLGSQKPNKANQHPSPSSLPCQKSAILTTFGMAVGLCRIRHECPLLRPQRPNLTPKVQGSPAHRIRHWIGLQHVRLKIGIKCGLGRQIASMVVGPDPANNKLIVKDLS